MESQSAYIECVPNFSEGRDVKVINAIGEAIRTVNPHLLLHVDSNASANRTVYTIAGKIDDVFEGVKMALRIAARKIDMRNQKGHHPRIGFADVIPFIPLKGIGFEALNKRVLSFAKEISGLLGLPIYMYEKSALNKERVSLSSIRKGEYEGLQSKMNLDEWKPDFGPTTFNPKLGATVMGVRDFLIAYNINISTKSAEQAMWIAKEVRSSSDYKVSDSGLLSKKEVNVPFIKAISWYIDEFKTYQISTNLTNFRVTGLHTALELCRKVSRKHGVSVTGSELIGLIPEKALVDAGKYYANKGQTDFVQIAINALNLSEVENFDPDIRILDRRVGFTVD